MDKFVETHARTTDPDTSRHAAFHAKNFYKTHCGIVYAALVLHGPQTVDELALNCELSSQQINKRLPDMEKMGLAWRSGKGESDAGLPCAIWAAKFNAA